MIQLKIVDVNSNTRPTVDLICQCGWVRRTYANSHSVVLAEHHIRSEHQEVGLIQYNNKTYKVS